MDEQTGISKIRSVATISLLALCLAVAPLTAHIERGDGDAASFITKAYASDDGGGDDGGGDDGGGDDGGGSDDGDDGGEGGGADDGDGDEDNGSFSGDPDAAGADLTPSEEAEAISSGWR